MHKDKSLLELANSCSWSENSWQTVSQKAFCKSFITGALFAQKGFSMKAFKVILNR